MKDRRKKKIRRNKERKRGRRDKGEGGEFLDVVEDGDDDSTGDDDEAMIAELYDGAESQDQDGDGQDDGLYGEYTICFRNKGKSSEGSSGVLFSTTQYFAGDKEGGEEAIGDEEGNPLDPLSSSAQIATKNAIKADLAQASPLKDSDLLPLQSTIQKTLQLATRCVSEQEYMRRRSERMLKTTESTVNRISGVSALSLGVLVLSFGAQIFYLRGYFQRKKLL
jgi:hypothetical protein